MEDGSWFFAVLIAGVITGLIGLWIAKEKGRNGGEGFLLGFLLSVIGLIVEGLLPEIAKLNPVRYISKADSRILALGNPEPTNEPPALSADGRPLRKCPFCAEMILAEAIICRYCQRDIPPFSDSQSPRRCP
jgi:uncharacterized membrane protein YeaQ/YmgE (transglycosylase-associated protein family)